MKADVGCWGLVVAIWLFVGAIESQIIAIGGLKSCCMGGVIAV